jgi:PleD family two-component response regulator
MKIKPTADVCDTDVRTLLTLDAVLGAAGFHVHTAQTAAEALDYAAVRPVDVAITEAVLSDSEPASAIHDYILFHNTRRRHSALGMLTRTDVEAAWTATNNGGLLHRASLRPRQQAS